MKYSLFIHFNWVSNSMTTLLAAVGLPVTEHIVLFSQLHNASMIVSYETSSFLSAVKANIAVGIKCAAVLEFTLRALPHGAAQFMGTV